MSRRLSGGLNVEVSHLEQSILPLGLASVLDPEIIRIIREPSLLPGRCFVTSFKRSATGTRGPPALFALATFVRTNFDQVVPILLEAAIEDHDGAYIRGNVFSDGREAVLEGGGLATRWERHCIVCSHYRLENFLKPGQARWEFVSACGRLRPAVEYTVHAG